MAACCSRMSRTCSRLGLAYQRGWRVLYAALQEGRKPVELVPMGWVELPSNVHHGAPQRKGATSGWLDPCIQQRDREWD